MKKATMRDTIHAHIGMNPGKTAFELRGELKMCEGSITSAVSALIRLGCVHRWGKWKGSRYFASEQSLMAYADANPWRSAEERNKETKAKYDLKRYEARRDLTTPRRNVLGRADVAKNPAFNPNNVKPQKQNKKQWDAAPIILNGVKVQRMPHGTDHRYTPQSVPKVFSQLRIGEYL